MQEGVGSESSQCEIDLEAEHFKDDLDFYRQTRRRCSVVLVLVFLVINYSLCEWMEK